MFKRFLAKISNAFKKICKRKVPLWVCFVSVFLIVLITFGGSLLLVNGSKAVKTAKKLIEIDRLVSKNYIEEVDYDNLDTAVLSAYMRAIEDKYGFYKSAEDAEAVSNSFEGSAEGIGVTVYYDNEKDALAVFRVDNDSPAHKAGIKVGDFITAIDGKTVKSLGYKGSLKAIKREVGKTADITILRGAKTLNLKVEYKDFIRQTVYAKRVANYGYFCFTAFNEATFDQFEKAYFDFLKQDVKGLIFDMRGNGGGTVDSVCEVLDTLVGKCNIMTTLYADGSKEVNATSDAQKTELPITVLVDGDTASAAELFAAAVRDSEKAVLIGNTTFGKGVVQRTYFLSDNSCVRFTVGEFLPPSGNSFNNKGLTPDYEVAFTDEQAKNPYILGNDDPYIKKAVEHLNGVTK